VLYFVDKEYAERLPLFALGFLSYFNDEVKLKFIKEFLDRMIGNYIYFVDKKLMGVYTAIDPTLFDVPGYKLYIIEISDDTEPKLSIL
jgi:hypothetical protein